MAPITTDPFPSISLLLSNDSVVFSDAVDVLLRVARNILKDPANLKYRSISLASSVVVNKLLPASGALECLFEMGFQEGSDCLELPLSKPITTVRLLHNELLRKREEKFQRVNPIIPTSSILGSPSATTAKDSPSTSAVPKQFNDQLKETSRTLVPPSKFDGIRSTIRNNFLQKVLYNCDRVLQYESSKLQLQALNCIPLQELKTRVETSIRNIQAAYKKKEVPSEHQNYQELMLYSLITWFKSDFFSWVNCPPCPKCQCEETEAKETRTVSSPGIDRVEIFQCSNCKSEIPFPRYNDAAKLLQTRRGRCGEWANCFTLLCRAMGWDARLVLDETDHAWTEVYLTLPGTWVHCDPCEGTLDAPLIYEVGWKKQLTYVMAYSHEEVQDVTWRYSAQHKKVLRRRKLCREEDLVQLIIQIRDLCGLSLSPARRQFVLQRSLREVIEMLLERQPNPGDLRGRVSGALAWRLARGETDDAPAHVWTVKTEDAVDGSWTIGYSAAKDEYVVGQVQKGWRLGVHQATAIQRKVENDWKMAYLARSEDSDFGTITWRFDVEEGAQMDTLELTFMTTVYKNGMVSVTICSGDLCVKVPADGHLKTSAFSGRRSIELIAVLSGGEGDVAWQHAQLFRQPLNDTGFPFQLRLRLLLSQTTTDSH